MKKQRRGVVYLVGAGPGDPGLVTRAGLACVREADVILYDHLVDAELLEARRPGCRLMYVGKQPGRQRVSQSDINRLLLQASRKYQRVVRLKGGDPFIFGRGGEEALALAQRGIAFEIIPGVSSASAVAAYAGIPLTHRGYASQVLMVTAHEDPEKENATVDWKAVARHRGTVVVFMGVARLAGTVRRLMRHGLSAHTPVGMVEYGTLPRQRSVTAQLKDIVKEAARLGIRHPALIVIGEVVHLRAHLNWFESKPLFGRKFLVTRPAGVASDLVRLLSAAGGQASVYPLLEIIPEVVPSGTLVRRMAASDWVIFTSRNAVALMFDILHRGGKDSRVFAGKKIAVMGAPTGAMLAGYGLHADCLPEVFSMEGLSACLSREKLAGKRVLLPHSRQGRPLLRQALRRQGARVQEIFLYRVARPRRATAAGLKRLLAAEQFDGVTFTSSSSVREFMGLLADAPALVGKQKLMAIGPVTAQTIIAGGFHPAVTAKTYSAAGLVAALCEHFGAASHD